MRLMTRLVMAALVIGTTACDSSTDPEDAIVGTYTLASVNGDPVPSTLIQVPDYRLEIVSGTLTVRDNNTWTETASIRETEGTTVTTSTTTVQGTYSINGNTATFTDSDGDSLTSTFSGGDTLTTTESAEGFTITFVYRK
jgi:hypothetical protein